MHLQDLMFKLSTYWAERGCVLAQGYDLEVGAGTMNPATFLRVLGPEPWSVAYVEPSRRPADGRFGENPNRLYQHHQFQVILKPSPKDVQEQYLGSLRAVGIRPDEHDIRFVEDDWESPTLNAWGLGWEVWCDGMEVTQFTYFQQAGGFDCRPVSAELTYGLERLAIFLQNVDNVFQLRWNKELTYGEILHRNEVEMSEYALHAADVPLHHTLFDLYEAECKRTLGLGLPLAAYDWCLKCSHTFNVLDARGAISVTERAAYIGRVRALAKGCAEGYLRMRAQLGFPLLPDRPRAEREAARILAPKAA